VPPVSRAGALAAGTKHTFIEEIQFLSVFRTLVVLFSSDFLVLSLEVWNNGFVLSEEVSHVHNQVLKHKHVSERSDDSWLGEISVIVFNASQGV